MNTTPTYALAGPPPPVPPFDPDPRVGPDAFLAAQRLHTAWTVAQLDAYRDALRLPTAPLAPLYGPPLALALAERNGKRDAAPWPALRSQQLEPSSILARRESRRRAALAADARAQYRSHYREWSGRRLPWTPRTSPTPWPAARPGQVTDADALALALQTIGARPHCSERVPDDMDDETPTSIRTVTLEWPERSETRPARLTSPRALLAVPGALPQPLDALPAVAGLPAAWTARPGDPIYLTAGTWTDEHGPAGGRVAHRVRLDIDGNLRPSGGRGNVARRPSTVPPGAVRTTQPVTLPDGTRQRLWLHLDTFRQIQAHTASGHPVALTPRARAAAMRRYFPTGAQTI